MTTTIEKTNENLILDAVRRDDVKLFSEIVSKEKSCFTLCFGRFPLLSLCYLYKSRKIIRAHGKKLAAVSGYLNADEPADAYQLFKKAAGTNLRLYDAESIVSPAEMLAVLQETDYLKQKFGSLSVRGKAVPNITAIYASRGQTVKADGKAFAAPREPMKKRQKIWLSVFAACACFFIAVYAVGLSLVSANLGLGTEKNPAKIYNAKQLEAISDKNGFYLLQNDISLPDNFSLDKLSAVLSGGGHTVTVNGSKPFAKEITGTVANLHFVLGTVEKTTAENFGFLTLKNSGVISSVTLSLNAAVTVESGGQDLQDGGVLAIGLIAGENEGTIDGCTVNGSVNITGLENVNTAAAAVAGSNSGLIESCVNNAEITADTADIAGIAGENAEKGKITSCLNSAKITQTTARENWNPNAAGITAFNEGEVTSCENMGSVSSHSTVTGNSDLLSIFAGGITCVNDNTVSLSKNSGGISIISSSGNAILYTAGIAALNTGKLIGNFASGALLATAESEAVLFLGGIAGWTEQNAQINFSEISNNFSLMSFTAGQSQAYIGGIAGSGFSITQSGNCYLYTIFDSNYYTTSTGASYGIGEVWYYALSENEKVVLYRLGSGTDFGASKVTQTELLQRYENYLKTV